MNDAGFTTFLVDDDPAVLKSITRLLKAGGYKTKSFSSPQKFLSAHDPSVPGCAIIDLVMAELDGLRVQEALLKSGSERPIIFLTGRGDVGSSVKAMKAGAVDFLTKPVELLDVPQGWGLGFHLYLVDLPGMRSAGSADWSGLFNSFFWIDRKAGIGAVIATQLLPFFDDAMVGTILGFEAAVYSELGAAI